MPPSLDKYKYPYTSANAQNAIAVTKCVLMAITVGEAKIPMASTGQVTACQAIKKSGQALAWTAVKQLDDVDVLEEDSIITVDQDLDKLGRWFDGYFDSTVTNVPQTARIWAFDAAKLLRTAIEANGALAGMKPLPKGRGFDGATGVAHYLDELGAALQSHDCSDAGDAARAVSDHYNTAQTAANAFINTINPTPADL